MTVISKIRDAVESTPFIDTHEHLLEESQRISGELDARLLPCDDFAYLFQDYVAEDLVAAGMPVSDLRRFLQPGLKPDAKFRLVDRYWRSIRNTGYSFALRHTFRTLYGEDDLTQDSHLRISAKYREFVKPGFYSEIFRAANVEHCHVNSLQRTFFETSQPAMLRQDLSILGFCRCSAGDLNQIEAETGKRPGSLDEWLEIVDQYFEKYGPKAVAVKCQIAYSRSLDFSEVSKAKVAKIFPNQADLTGALHAVGPEDLKMLQDFMIRYCLNKAEEYNLPVKLHTGILATTNKMFLRRVRDNASDLCYLLQEFPGVRFILMHIGYPYQHEFIALAKHYSNAYLDMCWAWIIDPVASTQFLKQYLVVAPSNKIFTFGGDYVSAEPIVGHAHLARLGISNVVSQLINEGWLSEEEAPSLINRLMRGNALEIFPSH
ncbi:amidohydrolase family protein [Sinorhizobium medicae]|nr:amidohydrolase family protein [Sinorhizobium medicae]MDX0421098.1 amidohydrolase family protein [Sinorhizobium medicae]MDX1034696.1 amidohydrolase family protein [Sinorhizobium medicae]